MNQVISSFDRAAATYDLHSHAQKQIARRLIELIQTVCHAPERIWEIGCGTGNLTKLLNARFPNAHVLATDGSQEMVQAASFDHPSESLPKTEFAAHLVNSFNDLRRPQLAKQLGQDRVAEQFDLIASSMALHWVNETLQCVDALLELSQQVAFAIPIDGTFSSWIAAHERLHLNHGVGNFLTEADLREWLDRVPQPSVLEIEEFHLQYDSPMEFVKELKLCGAATPRAGHRPVNLRKVFAAFSGGMTVTYRIAFVCVT